MPVLSESMPTYANLLRGSCSRSCACPHTPRLVVSQAHVLHYLLSPPAQLCTGSCSNKHHLFPLFTGFLYGSHDICGDPTPNQTKTQTRTKLRKCRGIRRGTRYVPPGASAEPQPRRRPVRGLVTVTLVENILLKPLKMTFDIFFLFIWGQKYN